MRFGLRKNSKAKKQLTTSPVLDINGKRSEDSGSKDEAFFDSRAWLDSDCEEDFFSVNGDFLPSRGSTPNHQTSNLRTLQLNKVITADTLSGDGCEPSTTESKKRLLEFLQESQAEEEGTHQNAKSEKIEFNGNGNGQLSDNFGSDYNLDDLHEDLKHQRDKTMKAKQYCCLPSLARTLSYRRGERK